MTEDEETTALGDAYDLEVKAAGLREFADLVDKGPDIPLKPSIFSALAREKADDYEAETERLRDSVPNPEARRCEVIEIDGQPAIVQTTGGPLNGQDRKVLEDFHCLLKRLHREDPGGP